MNPELLRRKRWFRALEIAKCIFWEQGYHTKYLEDIEEVLKGVDMYSPRIAAEFIPGLYRRAKTKGVPMTKLVNQIIGAALGEKKGTVDSKARENKIVIKKAEMLKDLEKVKEFLKWA